VHWNEKKSKFYSIRVDSLRRAQVFMSSLLRLATYCLHTHFAAQIPVHAVVTLTRSGIINVMPYISLIIVVTIANNQEAGL